MAGYERTRTSTCFLSYSRWANKWCMSIITKIPVIVFSVALTKPFLAWLLLFVPDSGYHAAFCSLHDLFLFKQFQEPPLKQLSCLFCVHTFRDRCGVYTEGNLLIFPQPKSRMWLFIDPRLIFLPLCGIKVYTDAVKVFSLNWTCLSAAIFTLINEQADRLKSFSLIMKALNCFHWTEYGDS